MPKLWKVHEMKIARYFHSERSGVAKQDRSGKRTRSDTTNRFLYIEIKSKKSHWIWSLFTGLKRKGKREPGVIELAEREQKIPMAALKEFNRHGFIGAWRSSDFTFVPILATFQLQQGDRQVVQLADVEVTNSPRQQIGFALIFKKAKIVPDNDPVEIIRFDYQGRSELD